MKNKKQILTGVVALVVGLGAGYGIHGFISPSRSAFPGGPSGMTGSFSTRTTQGGSRTPSNGLLTGTVATQDSGSITLNTRDGSSHVVLVTPATTVQKSVSGALTDVAVGSTIIVTGTTNGDGSVSATSIQLRPAMAPATVGK